MATTENQIFSSIKAGNPSPIYLITGEEDYYIDLVSDFLEQNIVDADYRDFDQVVLYGRDVSMLDIISRAKQYPMASARQLILVKEAQDMTSKDGGWDQSNNKLAQERTSSNNNNKKKTKRQRRHLICFVFGVLKGCTSTNQNY